MNTDPPSGIQALRRSLGWAGWDGRRVRTAPVPRVKPSRMAVCCCKWAATWHRVMASPARCPPRRCRAGCSRGSLMQLGRLKRRLVQYL